MTTKLMLMKLTDKFEVDKVWLDIYKKEDMKKLAEMTPSTRIALDRSSIRETGLKVGLSTVFLSVPQFHFYPHQKEKGQFQTLVEVCLNDCNDGILFCTSEGGENSTEKPLLKTNRKKLENAVNYENYITIFKNSASYDEAILFHKSAFDKLLNMSNGDAIEIANMFSNEVDHFEIEEYCEKILAKL